MNTTQLKALLALQKCDLTLIQLKKEALSIPERQEKIKSNAQTAGDQAAAAQLAVKECESAIKQIELEVEIAKQQINKYKTQQMQARTNEEYKTFEKEIANVGEKITEMEDRELIEMTRLDDVKATLAGARKKEQAAEEQVTHEIQALEDRLMVIRSTFAETKEGREDRIAEIDKEITDRYMQLLNKNQNAVVVPIRQQSCNGCHMKLTPQTLHDAHSQQKWTYCNFCGRLLYDDAELSTP